MTSTDRSALLRHLRHERSQSRLLTARFRSLSQVLLLNSIRSAPSVVSTFLAAELREGVPRQESAAKLRALTAVMPPFFLCVGAAEPLRPPNR